MCLFFAGTVVLLILGALWAWRGYRKESEKQRAQLAAETERWQKAKDKWEHPYYCFRDDIVFDLREGIATPADRMLEYVYQ